MKAMHRGPRTWAIVVALAAMLAVGQASARQQYTWAAAEPGMGPERGASWLHLQQDSIDEEIEAILAQCRLFSSMTGERCEALDKYIERCTGLFGPHCLRCSSRSGRCTAVSNPARFDIDVDGRVVPAPGVEPYKDGFRLCRMGHFKREAGENECVPCPKNSIAPQLGTVNCQGCGAYAITDELQTECLMDPAAKAEGKTQRRIRQPVRHI